MTDERTDAPGGDTLDPESLPRLAELLAGHLHEDWALDYGSAAEAVYDFVRDADWDDLEELAAEWAVFTHAARAITLEELNGILHGRFGSGWRVLTRGELDAVGQEIENAVRE